MTQAGSQNAGLIASGMESADWPKMTLPPSIIGKRRPGFQALVRQSAIRAIEEHGRGSMETEVCGVLVGNIYDDENGPLLYIRAIIRGELATGNVSQVTFTSQTWSHIHEEFERNFADQRIVGWYHTHPGHGVFLSGMDLFIHENFFDLPWQAALVFDPQNSELGLFLWKDKRTSREEFLIERDVGGEQNAVLNDLVGEPQVHFLLRLGLAIGSWFGKKNRPAALVPPKDAP